MKEEVLVFSRLRVLLPLFDAVQTREYKPYLDNKIPTERKRIGAVEYQQHRLK
jgi:hypothetical protein